jgi:serine/threonine-protein kinase RsbW
MNDLEYNINRALVSERKSIKLVEPIIKDLRKSIEISDDLYYNMLIASTEAVNNAIIHGNRCCCSKKVMIHISANSSSITINVSDQGCGFNPEAVEDPRNPDNILKAGGRGIFLIKELSDEANFKSNEEGSEIIMKFLIK